MKKPVLETHYGKEVWTNKKMDKLRQKECLCLNCGFLDRCPKAQLMFVETLSHYGIALAITRCSRWEEIKKC